MRPDPKERLLRHIFGGRMISEYASGESHCPSEVAIEQSAKGLTVSRPGLEHEDLIGVVQSRSVHLGADTMRQCANPSGAWYRMRSRGAIVVAQP
jgi:hypothetical protein